MPFADNIVSHSLTHSQNQSHALLDILIFWSKIDQRFGKVGDAGKNETLEDFEIFNIRNTVNIVAYSVMSAGKN